MEFFSALTTQLDLVKNTNSICIKLEKKGERIKVILADFRFNTKKKLKNHKNNENVAEIPGAHAGASAASTYAGEESGAPLSSSHSHRSRSG